MNEYTAAVGFDSAQPTKPLKWLVFYLREIT
jgi:hypothetical protein